MVRMKLTLEQVETNEWKFKYPKTVNHLNDKLYDAIELKGEGDSFEAENILRSIIEEFPEHIDAYNHLAMLLKDNGKNEEAFHLCEKAVNIGVKYFSKNFDFGKDILEWGWLENRPFLRAYEGLGFEYYKRGSLEKALQIFNNLLSLNPNDNQGIRALVIENNLALKCPYEILKVCDKFPDGVMADTLYGRVLAMFQMTKKNKAEAAMKAAMKSLPLVAKELVKKRHKRPKSMKDGFITIGGEDQAYDYWQRAGKYWKETTGAIGFVKECLSK